MKLVHKTHNKNQNLRLRLGRATDIQNEFLENRDWHSNVVCSWDGEKLKLVAENDFDQDGQALLDEFGDCIAAYVIDYFDSNIKIESVNEI